MKQKAEADGDQYNYQLASNNMFCHVKIDASIRKKFFLFIEKFPLDIWVFSLARE
jgi:hypothetical protein